MRIVTRDEWGALPPNHTPIRLRVPTRDLILHHAGGGGLVTGARRVRAIQRFHMGPSRGWNDIAYNYLIESGGPEDGVIFEGRGGGIQGGATFGENDTSHAICLLGNFNDETPTAKALDSLVWLIGYGRDQGWWPDHLTGGHRDFRPTSCPGDNLYRLIPEINSRVEDDMPSLDEIRQVVEQVVDERAARAVWAPGKDAQGRYFYTIPDPSSPDGVHPNTLLRKIRDNTAPGKIKELLKLAAIGGGAGAITASDQAQAILAEIGRILAGG